MSDYFGALIRSSGLTIAGHAQAPPLQPQLAAGLVEITEEREAPPAASSETGVADRREASASPPVIEIEAGPSTIVLPRPATAPVDGPATHRPLPMASTVSPVEMPAAAREDAAPSPAARAQPASFDPVRAVMQWVASDPEARLEHAPQPSHRRSGGALPSTPQAGMDAVKEERVVISEHIATTSVDDNHSRAATGEVAAGAIAPVPHARERHLAPAPRPVRTTARASADEREETIEISIGAINLHVDAPAPHTVVQAPPAPRPRPAPERRAERSGLARRYLRSL